MKRCLSVLLTGFLLAVSFASFGFSQQPCPCSKTTAVAAAPTQDDVDFAEAIIRGYGDRVAVGPYRGVTKAIQQYRADLTAGRADAKSRFEATWAVVRPAPNPQRKCNLATMAVAITPAMIEMMDPTMPPAQLAEIVYGLEMVQAMACGTPVPPTPAAAPVTPAKIPPLPVLKQPAAAPSVPKQDVASNWLSEQFVLDGCGGSNGGCNGDDNTTVLGVAKNLGIPRAIDYGPYQASYQGCHVMSGTPSLYTVSDWGYVLPNTTGTPQTDQDIAYCKAAIMLYGGIGNAIAADGAFENYSGGVFTGRSQNVNHDVFTVGWDDAKGASVGAKTAWLGMNSWGPWGIDPTTGKSVPNAKAGKPTGLKLPDVKTREWMHAAYRMQHTKGASDIDTLAAKILANPTAYASYNALGVQPPMEDQTSCGSCWIFSGVRMVSAANILKGFLPKSATPITTGCFWIANGSNSYLTEPVYCVGGGPVPYVAPPINPPSPDTPTRRTSVLFEKATNLYKTQPAKVLKALDAAEQALAN